MIENNEVTKFKENQILIHDFNQTSIEKQFSIKGLNLSKSYKSCKFIFFSQTNHLVLDRVNINIEKGKM
jgi:hypothetical protein